MRFYFLLGISFFFFNTTSLFLDQVLAENLILPTENSALVLEPQEKLITILGTNDIHGWIEPRKGKDGIDVGGMAFWSGAVRAIREGLKKQFGDQAEVLLLDAGDQFQGTLLSNYEEGHTVFEAMNRVGYDAVIPGNHDYDFGPIGWQQDRVIPGLGDQDPRGALKLLVKTAQFPLLSANTYYKNSIVDFEGNPVSVQGEGCKVLSENTSAETSKTISWKKARRPEFLKPWLLKEVAGIPVAIIGLDHPQTPNITTRENVSDLCFRELEESYLDTVEEILEFQKKLKLPVPLIFVLVLHHGNTSAEFPVTRFVQKIEAAKPNSLHAVVSGHTHFYTNTIEKGIPIIQSHSGGTKFGRIDLIWNAATQTLVGSKKRIWASLPLQHTQCAPFMRHFCKVLPNGQVSYEGIPIVADESIQSIIQAARKKIAPLATRSLGTVEGRLSKDRIKESPLANQMTDALLSLATSSEKKVDVAFLNTSGLREEVDSGDFTYEELFQVLPFSNHAVILSPLTMQKFFRLLNRSIQTCGAYGALMPSGLRVAFERDCRPVSEGGRNKNGLDKKAKLIRVENLAGDLLIENGAILPAHSQRTLTVVTLDFLADGGSGYADFGGTPQVQDLGILREEIAKKFFNKPNVFKGEIDGRWKELAP